MRVRDPRTNVQILRRLHNQPPSDGAGEVELLMGGVEEADEIPNRKKRGVAQTGACGMMQSVKRNVVVDYTEH